jgi:hypothetical protein
VITPRINHIHDKALMSITTQIQPKKRFLLSQSSPCGKKTTSRELEDAMNVVKTVVVLLDLHIIKESCDAVSGNTGCSRIVDGDLAPHE